MPKEQLHEDEMPLAPETARRLIARHCPQWRDLPVTPFPSAGTDNHLFRLGRNKTLRVPRHPRAVASLLKERRWLPTLTPALPLPLPEPLFGGEPDEICPFPWNICRWVEGRSAIENPVADSPDAAVSLAEFIKALQRLDASGAPRPGEHNFRRGVPLAERDAGTRTALTQLAGHIDVDKARGLWESALKTPAWEAPPVWIHGDLHPGNLLSRDGRIAGVVDFGGLGAGDPACDVMAAWTMFDAPARNRFREALAMDAATWSRGRGWALSFAVIVLPYYLPTSSPLVDIARWTIAQVLSDEADA